MMYAERHRCARTDAIFEALEVGGNMGKVYSKNETCNHWFRWLAVAPRLLPTLEHYVTLLEHVEKQAKELELDVKVARR